MPTPREVTETIHQRITRLRIEHDWSQAELARRMDVSTGTVQHWEAGRAFPTLLSLPVLAKLFGVSAQYLLTGSNLEEEPDTVRHATLMPIIEALRDEVTRLEGLVAKHPAIALKPVKEPTSSGADTLRRAEAKLKKSRKKPGRSAP